MSVASAHGDTIIIGFEVDLISLLDIITELPVNPPSIYLNFEGIDLGRHGSLSIMSLHIAPTQQTYLIDIHSLGKDAFSTTNNSGTPTKTNLESSTIPKVVFDIRNGSNALFNLFQISVNDIKDPQLIELACRKGLLADPCSRNHEGAD